MNDWALITGASSGIGRELAGCFAADRFHLVLVARNEKKLEDLAEELHLKHGIMTKVLVRNLAIAGTPQDIFDSVRDLPVSILVNNAGFGVYGPFSESDLATQAAVMRVNMTALVELTHLFLQPMLSRHRGRILNVASVAAFQPGPTMNIYYASKAFVHSFSYALAMELEGTGVTVTALCPSTTRTDFFSRAKMKIPQNWFAMDARAVAEAGHRGLMRGKRVVIPGLLNRILAALARRGPVSVAAGAVRKIHAQ
jgi:short-subunit dehydrogenase